jgi:hypothetical protein
MQITTIGLDIAKNVFQVHAIDPAGKVVVRKQLRRNQVVEFFKALPACLVGTLQRTQTYGGTDASGPRLAAEYVALP